MRDTSPSDSWVDPGAFGASPTAGGGLELPLLAGPLPGPQSRRWTDTLARHECPGITARRARRQHETGVDQDPVVWERSCGVNVWDTDGNRLVDLTGGFGAAAVGHGHPAVRAAVHAQVDQHIHGLGDAFPARIRIELAERLCGKLPAGLEQVIFASTGSEAVEVAIKTAVLATGRSAVLAFDGSYHGLSLGIVPISSYKPDFREPFRGLAAPWARFQPFGLGGAELARTIAEWGEPPAAIVVEPIQGRGGVRVAPPHWLHELRALCDKIGALLVFDEVFTGVHRAGAFVRAQVEGVRPDLLCVGKALGGGFPLSACVGTREAMAAWGESKGEAIHTSTFLGHPIGCAAAMAVLNLSESGLDARADLLGASMASSLSALVSERPTRFRQARGAGAFWALLPDRPARSFPLCRALLRRGFLVLPCGLSGEAIGFSPPLVTSRAVWDGVMAALAEADEEVP